MLMLPEEPAATIAVALVDESTENEAAAVPPKLTEVILDRLLPLIVIVAPVAADKGVNELITGGAT